MEQVEEIFPQGRQDQFILHDQNHSWGPFH